MTPKVVAGHTGATKNLEEHFVDDEINLAHPFFTVEKLVKFVDLPSP